MRGFPPNEVSRHHKWFQTGVEKPDVSTFALYVWAAATCPLEVKWKVMRPRMSLAVRSFQRAASFICTFTNCSNCEAVQAGEGTIPKKKKKSARVCSGASRPVPGAARPPSSALCIRAVMTFTPSSVFGAWIEAARMQCRRDPRRCWVISLCVCTPPPFHARLL